MSTQITQLPTPAAVNQSFPVVMDVLVDPIPPATNPGSPIVDVNGLQPDDPNWTPTYSPSTPILDYDGNQLSFAPSRVDFRLSSEQLRPGQGRIIIVLDENWQPIPGIVPLRYIQGTNSLPAGWIGRTVLDAQIVPDVANKE